jgi:hypothetical protein
MSSYKQTRVFDPLELEIIDRIYEAAWAQLEAREPSRDRETDGERQEALRKRIFAVAGTARVEFDTLCDKVLAFATPLVEPPKPLAHQQRRSFPKAAS